MCQSQGAHVRLMIDNIEPHCKLELQNNDTKEENISLKLKKTRLGYAIYQYLFMCHEVKQKIFKKI